MNIQTVTEEEEHETTQAMSGNRKVVPFLETGKGGNPLLGPAESVTP